MSIAHTVKTNELQPHAPGDISSKRKGVMGVTHLSLSIAMNINFPFLCRDPLIPTQQNGNIHFILKYAPGDIAGEGVMGVLCTSTSVTVSVATFSMNIHFRFFVQLH